jgi:UrcA family protein
VITLERNSTSVTARCFLRTSLNIRGINVTLKNSNHLSAFPVRFVVIGLALSSSAALFAGELTVSSQGIPTVKVDYSGIDPSTNTGATRLYRQLRNAAAQVCSSLEGRDLSLQAQWHRCYNKALSGAVVDANRPLVTALHQRQSSGLTPTIVASRAVKPAG